MYFQQGLHSCSKDSRGRELIWKKGWKEAEVGKGKSSGLVEEVDVNFSTLGWHWRLSSNGKKGSDVSNYEICSIMMISSICNLREYSWCLIMGHRENVYLLMNLRTNHEIYVICR